MAFDADDTLWDFTTTMWAALAAAIEVVRTDRPDVAAHLRAADLQAVRDRLAREAEESGGRISLAEVRRRSFATGLVELAGGQPGPELDDLAGRMDDAYFAHRHGRMRLYPDAAATLAELGERYVLGIVTNGNTHPGTDGLPVGTFAFHLGADQVGIRKPDPRLFLMAAAAAGCHPNELVMVGDQVEKDVVAPQAVGVRAVWVNRTGAPCPPGVVPDATIGDLAELPAVLAAFERSDDDAAAVVGVGPHPEPWPDDDRLDPALLAGGDRRNVVDRYRYWREEAVVADLAARAHPVHVAVENWRSDRNIGTVVRNANAFGAAGVHIVGRRRWNRRGAMATDRYLPVHHHDTLEQLTTWAAAHDLAVVGIDNLDGSVPIETSVLPRACVLLFGQEGPGLSVEARDACELVCSITQYGSTRSINAGVASGIALHAWVRTHAPA